MIRLKNGLVKWSNAHKELAAKSHLIFSATHDIAQLIPDVPNTSEIQVHLFDIFPMFSSTLFLLDLDLMSHLPPKCVMDESRF